MANERDCNKCIHRIPCYNEEGDVWKLKCEVWNCRFVDREECLNAYYLLHKKTDLDEETIEESDKLTKEQWENLWDSGYLGGVI